MKRESEGLGDASDVGLTPLANYMTSRQRQQTRDANHRNDNKAADHGERVFVDTQHKAPH
jgi:hypothetical protein